MKVRVIEEDNMKNCKIINHRQDQNTIYCNEEKNRKNNNKSQQQFCVEKIDSIIAMQCDSQLLTTPHPTFSLFSFLGKIT